MYQYIDTRLSDSIHEQHTMLGHHVIYGLDEHDSPITEGTAWLLLLEVARAGIELHQDAVSGGDTDEDATSLAKLHEWRTLYRFAYQNAPQDICDYCGWNHGPFGREGWDCEYCGCN